MTRPSHRWIFAQTRWFLLLLVSVLLPSQLFGCASTSTGNPPLVEEEQILIERSDGGVRVSGDAGAVAAGAEVEVENLSTGASATTTASDAGAFEVVVAGSTADDYRVVVTSGERSDSVTVGAGGTGNLEETLLDRSFLLDEADGYTPVEGTTIRVSFNGGEFGFSAGCNSHFGEYALCGDRLCIPGLGSTQIGCELEHRAQDQWLAEFFTSEPQIDLDGDQLTFTGSEATLVFLDREVANPDRPLTGRIWTVDTLIDGGAATNIPVSTPPTLEFSDDGTLEVFAVCNDLVFSHGVDEAEIMLSLVSTTRNACTGDAAGELAEHLSEVLRGTVTYEIEAQRLTLMNGSIGLGATTD